jgi:3-deoxy-D-manno-octulosonate 8-phosphate phosphatase (KDO 8-P phosphatase)
MSAPCSPPASGYPSDCEVLEGLRTRSQAKTAVAEDPRRSLALAKAREIKLLLLDVDGVLTDGRLLYSEGSSESKSFHTQDGFGLRLLREGGVETGVITARNSVVVARRAAELQMKHIHQGAGKKDLAFREILSTTGLKPYQVAYMGDDWLDLVVLQQAGLAIAPANAVLEVKDTVHFVTRLPGGHGAVREACELILEGREQLAALLQKYRSR